MDRDATSGWMAQIVGPDGETPVTDKAQAEAIAKSHGCTVEWEEDAENGCWAVSITIEQREQMFDDQGWLDLTNEQGSILIDAGDTKEEENERR